MDKPDMPRLSNPVIPLSETIIEKRQTYFTGSGFFEVTVYDRSKLFVGAEISGPAIVEEKDASTLVDADQILTVDEYGNLIIQSA